MSRISYKEVQEYINNSDIEYEDAQTVMECNIEYCYKRKEELESLGGITSVFAVVLLIICLIFLAMGMYYFWNPTFMTFITAIVCFIISIVGFFVTVPMFSSILDGYSHELKIINMYLDHNE